ncbi:hypothetical protein HWV62_44131, partial [Athelia sp. TMB]
LTVAAPAPGASEDVTYPPQRLGHDHPVTDHQAKLFRRRSHIHFAALCWFMFLEGWNDGTPGPLLPTIQEVYHVMKSLAVLLFYDLTKHGFISGAFANIWLNDKLGFGKVLVLGAACQVITYAIQSPAPPFPVMVLANAIGGFGIALQAGQEPGEVQGQGQADRGNKFSQILGLKTVHTLAFFILVYVGTELTTDEGWIVTFIIRERDGGRSAGYISAGFFGGLTLGRIVLMWFNRMLLSPLATNLLTHHFHTQVGPQKVIFIYLFLVIGLELTVWLVPSMIENAVAVAVIGLFLGPMYPLVMTHTSKVLPKWLVTGAIGWIAGFGQVGDDDGCATGVVGGCAEKSAAFGVVLREDVRNIPIGKILGRLY